MRRSTMVGPEADTATAHAGPAPYGWDWSDTTHDALGSGVTVREVVTELCKLIGGSIVAPTGKGLHGWSDSVDVFDCDGYRLGRVYFCSGPAPARTDVFVRSTSAVADIVRPDVLGAFNAKSSRVDTRVDCLAPWNELVAIMEEAAGMYGTQMRYVESFDGRGCERKSRGRTWYMGAPTSWIQIRLYEKHLESPGQYVEGTNRLEVQLRPPSRKKGDVSDWSRAETFCVSRTTRALAAQLGTELAEPGTLQIQKGTPELEQTLEAASNQYGKAFARFLELSGGDVDTLVDWMTRKV